MTTSTPTIFYAANVFTSQTRTSQKNVQQTIKNAAIVVENGMITWLGIESDLPEQMKNECKTENEYRFTTGWLTTGLIDCHTHLIYGGNRSGEFKQRLEGVAYKEIARQGGGILSTVKATRQETEDELFDSALKRLHQLRSEGVTCLEIKSGYGLELDAEIKMLKVARKLAVYTGLDIKTTCLAAHAVPEEYKDRADDYIDYVCDQILPEASQQNLVDAVDGFCENIGFNTKQISRVFDKAMELGLPVKLHAEQLSNQHGASLAAKYSALSVDHLEYLDEDGVSALKVSGTVAVLLPGAFYTLRETQKPPIEQLRKYQVPIAIATDSNPGSSPCNSLLLMLNMACTLFQLTVDEALMAVTTNAAKALGLEATHGQIQVGMNADFVHWDVKEVDELCYYFGTNPCTKIFKNGEPLKE